VRLLALVRDDTPVPALLTERPKPRQIVFTAFFAFYVPICPPGPDRRRSRRRRRLRPRQLEIPPIQRLFAAFLAFYLATCERRKRRRCRRRRHVKSTQMRLPLRKNRRRAKPFCLGTGKLTPRELDEVRRREQRAALRLRRHLPVIEAQRPRTRADCLGHAHPCMWVGCRHHLYLDVNPENGSIKLNFPGVPLEKLTETCSLDVADKGGETLDVVGELMNITMERVRQIEVDAVPKLGDGLRWEDSDLYR